MVGSYNLQAGHLAPQRTQHGTPDSRGHTTSGSSAHYALVVVEHQPSLKVVSECAHCLIAKEVLEEGKDALARGRIGRNGEDDARRQRPGGEGARRKPSAGSRIASSAAAASRSPRSATREKPPACPAPTLPRRRRLPAAATARRPYARRANPRSLFRYSE